MKIDKWAAHTEQSCQIGRHHWSVARLITCAADLPVQRFPLDAIALSHTYKSLRLRDFVMHMRAVMEADLEKPIILDEDGELMDGRHRIMRAIYEGKATILAVRFDTNPAPCRVSDD